ncbi:hypothetical protein KKE78_05455 [Patescibacteria group bacterium]|nr:hypothetical protein [Patescibacteria group bacterium]
MNRFKIITTYVISIIICALIARWFFENFLYPPLLDIPSGSMTEKLIESERAFGGIIAMYLGGILGIVLALLGRIVVSLQCKKS